MPLWRDLHLDLVSNLLVARAGDLALDITLANARGLASDLADGLTQVSVRVRRQLLEEPGTAPRGDDRAEARVPVLLARVLPPAERSRFVAEERGNLGGCETWWHRVDHLVGVALGTPGLALMMRTGRRGRRA